MGPADKVPSPSRREITSWTLQAWNTISPETIRKTFEHIGFHNEDRAAGHAAEAEGQEAEGEELVDNFDLLVI